MLKVIIRTFIIYIFIALAIKLMGKRQVGDMQPNELIVTLLISELVAISLQDLGQPISLSMVSIFILCFLEIAVSVIGMKFPKIRRLLSGNPIAVIEEGKINQKNMEKLRISMLDLMQLLRNEGIFDISTVYYAIIEVNGTLSVQLNAENMPITHTEPKNSLPLTVISDGKTVESSLVLLDIKKEDLIKTLNEKGLKIKDIYFMSISKNKPPFIVKKEDVI